MAKRYSQPQSGAQIDRNNPLSRGLMLAYLPQTNFANLAKQTYPLSSAYAILATGVGRAGVNRLAYPSRAVTWAPPTGLSQATVLVVARNLAESTANIAFDVSSGGGNEFTSYSDNKIYSGGFSGARYVSAFAIPAGTLLSPFVYAVAGVSGNHSTWLNSQKIGSASTAAFSAAASWGIGTQPGGAGTNTEVYLALAWDRALSDAELKSISANPWQLFAPDSSRIWVPVAAGGDTYTLTADSGSFALTGQDTALNFNRTIAADSGSFALTGQAAALTFNRTLVADSGSFALAGQDATPTFSRVLSAASGSYALAGQDATLTYTPISGATYTLAAASGSFALAGQGAVLLQNRSLAADSGSFALTGQDATLARGYMMPAQSGDYSVAGQDAALIASRRLAADSAAFALAGQSVTMTYSNAPPAVVAGAVVGRRMAVTGKRPDRLQTAGRPAR